MNRIWFCLILLLSMYDVCKSQTITVTSQVEVTYQRNEDIIEINKLWHNYLSSRPDSLYNNPYWNSKDKMVLQSYDLLNSEGYQNLYALSKYGDLHNRILSITPMGEFYNIRSMYYWPTSPPYILSITNVLAKKENNGEYKLYNWLHYYTRDWKVKEVGIIKYCYYPEYNFSRKNAKMANKFLRFLSEKFEMSIDTLTIYISNGWSETELMKGYDYTLSSTVVSDNLDLGGTTDIINNIIYSNSAKGELYEHEFMRLVKPYYPNAHRLLWDGITEYFTLDQNMRGIPIKEHFSRFDTFLSQHPEIDLQYFDSFNRGNLVEANYLLGLLIVQMIIDKGGFDLLKSCMRNVSTDDQLRLFMQDYLNIASDEINDVFRYKIRHNSL